MTFDTERKFAFGLNGKCMDNEHARRVPNKMVNNNANASERDPLYVCERVSECG